MRRVRILTVCAALALFVYTGATATDARVDRHDLFLPSYLLVQLLAGIAAIPVWRRHIMHASVRRYKLLSL